MEEGVTSPWSSYVQGDVFVLKEIWLRYPTTAYPCQLIQQQLCRMKGAHETSDIGAQCVLSEVSCEVDP